MRGISVLLLRRGAHLRWKTKAGIRARIRRHLTNQRTDAVAMSVLDPFEVAEIEMWPFWDLPKASIDETLNRAEFTVF